MYRSLCTKELTFHERQWASVSDDAIDLVLWMLSPDVTKRATAVDVLNHPWVVRHTGQHLYLEVDELSDMIATASVVLHPKEVGRLEHKQARTVKSSKQSRRGGNLKDQDKSHFAHFAAVLCPSSAKSSKVLS